MTEFNPPSYPIIDATNLHAFQREFQALEWLGQIDSEGGSEWRGTLAEAMCRHLGIDATVETVDWLRYVIEYVEFGLTENPEDQATWLSWDPSPP